MSLIQRVTALAQAVAADIKALYAGKAEKGHTHTTAQITGLDSALESKASKAELTGGLDLKVDKVTGKGLSDTNFTQVEKTKLTSVANGATANRADSENADKLHTHTTAQVTGLDTALADKADKTTQVIAGTGLTGGGTLAANRTLNVQYGTSAGTAAQGNDSRLSNSREWTAAVVSQAEAEAGTSTTARKWTAQRVAQAISALGLKIGTTASTAKAGNWTPTWTEVSNKPSTFTPDSHTHSLSEVTDAGSLAALNTNASTSNFLRGDGTWVTPPNTNTTYTEITTAEIDAGTASTLRTISGRRMKYALDKKSDIGHGHSISDVTGLQAAIDSKANTSTQVTAGTGLSGGGSLETNRTLSVNYGTSAGTAAQGNDVRINNGQTAFGWGNHASAGYAKTKADVGLSGIPNTNASTANFLRGDGKWVTPPNTTYSEISTAEISSGTASTGRTISGRRMKYALDKKADTTTQVIAGTGLTGGGTLAANRTLAVTYGTTAGSAAQGNDSRITGSLQKSQVVQVTGTSTTDVMSQKAVTDAIAAGGGSGGGSVNVVQSDGFSASAVMSQYAVTEALYEVSIIANICWTYDKEQHAAIHALDPQTATLPQLIEALQSATLLDYYFEMPPPEP